MNNKSIGVFDSGLGGLTVVKEIITELPIEDIVYFGEEISKYMTDYIANERDPGDKDEKALFVASRGEKKRLTVRSVERIVSKYKP